MFIVTHRTCCYIIFSIDTTAAAAVVATMTTTRQPSAVKSSCVALAVSIIRDYKP